MFCFFISHSSCGSGLLKHNYAGHTVFLYEMSSGSSINVQFFHAVCRQMDGYKFGGLKKRTNFAEAKKNYRLNE